MAEIAVVKQPTAEKPELTRWFGFDTPLLRGSVFSLNPFALVKQFAEDMDRTIARGPATAAETGAWIPAIEVKQKEGKLLLTAELPGVKTEDVKVHIDGKALVVEGERKEEKEEKREGFYHSERSYGKFYRSILLPEGAKAELTAAKFTNGVLEVTVPIAEAKEARKEIPIQGETKKAA